MTAMAVSVSEHDVGLLIGVVAIVSGHLLAEMAPATLFGPMKDRFVSAGVVDDASDQRTLSMACERLVGRLRIALGEYDDEATEP
jgi:hypothetical protein